MQKKTIAAFITFGLIAMLGIGFAAAHQGGFGFAKSSDITDEDKAEWQAHREDIKEAIENNDYEAWKTLMESELTEEKFSKIVERHAGMQEKYDQMLELKEAIKNGDTKTIEQLKEQFSEYGHGFRGFHKNRMHFGFNK